jgi:hypothetical protein
MSRKHQGTLGIFFNQWVDIGGGWKHWKKVGETPNNVEEMLKDAS